MAKVHIFNLFGSVKSYLSTEQIKKILIIAFGISQSRSVNMNKVNEKILGSESGSKTPASQYVWLLKLFQTGNSEKLIQNCFQLIVIYIYGGEEKVSLVIDRTNWDLGQTRLNVLVIGLLTSEGIFIPLICSDLGYKGNSESQQRLSLMDKLVEWWSALNIPVPTFEICGDREFIGEYWLTELSRRGIHYVIRLRSNLSFETWLNEAYKVEKRFEIKTLHRYLMIYKKESVEVILQQEAIAKVFVVENEVDAEGKEPYLYFITNLEDLDAASLAYRKRWKIEVFFKYMKSQGFDLEGFNMIGSHKMEILMSILSIVYLIVIELHAVEKEKIEVAKKAIEAAQAQQAAEKLAAFTAEEKEKLERANQAHFASEKARLERENQTLLANQLVQLEKQKKAQFAQQEAKRRATFKKQSSSGSEKKQKKKEEDDRNASLEKDFQRKLDRQKAQLKEDLQRKLEAQYVKLETKHSDSIYNNGKVYARKSAFLIGRGIVAKLRSFDNFLEVCQQISEKILHNLKLLRALYINKTYA